MEAAAVLAGATFSLLLDDTISGIALFTFFCTEIVAAAIVGTDGGSVILIRGGMDGVMNTS